MDQILSPGEGSDDEFELEPEKIPKRRKCDSGASRKRTTRSMIEQKHGTKTFTALLQEVRLPNFFLKNSISGTIG